MSEETAKLYFAFGSNMFHHRMTSRIPQATCAGVARLDGHVLTFHKRGGDNTGKCSIEPWDGCAVWGVLWRMPHGTIKRLDGFEGNDYSRDKITVVGERGQPLTAFTYRAKARAVIEAMPAAWYRDIVLAGAMENKLPEAYVNEIAGIPATGDT